MTDDKRSNNMSDETLRGNVRIDFDTDGDFGFSDLDSIEKLGWKVEYDEASQCYTFSISDFVGTARDLYWSIIQGPFGHVHTSKVYVMESLCSVFRSLENHLNALVIEPEFYEDMGNQQVSATFNLAPANKRSQTLKKIEELKLTLKYYEDQEKDYHNSVVKMNHEIEMLQRDLDNL